MLENKDTICKFELRIINNNNKKRGGSRKMKFKLFYLFENRQRNRSSRESYISCTYKTVENDMVQQT